MNYIRTHARRLALALGILVALSTALVTLTPNSATAGAGAGGMTIVSYHSNLDMEVGGWSVYPDATVDQWSNNGSNASYTWPGLNQLWELSAPGEGLIQNAYSQMCLTTDGVAGHQLFQEICHNNYWTQDWVVNTVYRPSYSFPFYYVVYDIYNPTSGLYIDVNQSSTSNGAAIIGWPYNGGDNQMWNLGGA